jgi:hypothetical protein
MTINQQNKILDTFIQPKLKNILREIGLENGLIYSEIEKYFLLYYEEFVLKNLSDGKSSTINLVGFGSIRPSKRRTIQFKNSKYNKGLYAELIKNLIISSKFNEEEIIKFQQSEKIRTNAYKNKTTT